MARHHARKLNTMNFFEFYTFNTWPLTLTLKSDRRRLPLRPSAERLRLSDSQARSGGHLAGVRRNVHFRRQASDHLSSLYLDLLTYLSSLSTQPGKQPFIVLDERGKLLPSGGRHRKFNRTIVLHSSTAHKPNAESQARKPETSAHSISSSVCSRKIRPVRTQARSEGANP